MRTVSHVTILKSWIDSGSQPSNKKNMNCTIVYMLIATLIVFNDYRQRSLVWPF